MKFRVCFLVVFCLSIFIFTVNAQKISEMPTVSVNGAAEIFVVPDEAIFSLGVSKINTDLQIAKSQNDKSVSQILALTKRFGIESKDVKTDYISVSKRYEFVGRGDARRRVFKGYEVSKTVIVKLRDLSKFESFFSEVLKTGVSEIRRVNFATSELRKYKDEARSKAIVAAKEKATAIAGAIGQTVGKAIQIEEKITNYYPRNIQNESNYAGFTSGSGGNSGTFSAGTISIKAQVGVKFMLN